MTRGTLFYYESNDRVWSSTEFNEDMYHGTAANPQGMGDEVIKLMVNLESVDDFMDVLAEINHHYKYDEGDECYSVGPQALEVYAESLIKWVDNERPDLKGNSDFDPRTWTKKPSFKDVRTWKFWGKPNLSDYSYIYNNSGKDLTIYTKSKPIKMVIPNGCLGVLNFGAKDCLCKDGKIIDGMGNYEEDKPEEETPVVEPLAKKKYICDGGSILIGTRDSNACFPNGYGDGEHTVYVVNSKEQGEKIDLNNRKKWYWLGTVGGDRFNVYYYDCLRDEGLDDPENILFTLSGRYGVYHCDGAIALEYWG